MHGGHRLADRSELEAESELECGAVASEPVTVGGVEGDGLLGSSVGVEAKCAVEFGDASWTCSCSCSQLRSS